MAVFLSIGLPGVGHFYLRRPLLGSIEMFGAVLLLGAALVRLAETFVQVTNDARPLLDLIRVTLDWTPALVLYSLLDGCFTWLISRRHCVVKDPR